MSFIGNHRFDSSLLELVAQLGGQFVRNDVYFGRIVDVLVAILNEVNVLGPYLREPFEDLFLP